MTQKDSEPQSGLGAFIKAQRELANLSLRQLSDLAKVSNPYLSQVERGLYKPSADVLKNIATALHVSAETMFAQAGLLDPEIRDERPSTVLDAIRLDERLSTDQKETLIRIYKGFLERA
jgi:transcriptional regulator with XRE-family HTH domain